MWLRSAERPFLPASGKARPGAATEAKSVWPLLLSAVGQTRRGEPSNNWEVWG